VNQTYHTPAEWYKNHKSQLKQYRGQWIAFTKDGIIAHHQNFKTMMIDLNANHHSGYVIERIFENEFMDAPQLLPVRFKSLKKHEWQPKYEVLLTFQQAITVKMLVDSGADFSAIPKELGITLGYTQAPGETIHQANGVGGSVDYFLRNIEITIDSKKFSAPVAWLQTEECEEILLGRESVFDLFDIEFKQAEETIIFKDRTSKP
jgi:hypothetical protein